jgi:phytoene/squalene synthetase
VSAREAIDGATAEILAIEGIRRAAAQRADADRLRHDATNDLRNYCRAAHVAGVSITRIAHEAGLSRQGVYDLLGGPPPS